VQVTIRTFGKLDVLVNDAGYGNVAPIEDTTLKEFRAQIETNLFGVTLTKAVLRYFRERGSGRMATVPSGREDLLTGRSPAVRIRFEEQAGRMVMTLNDGDGTLDAARVRRG
jgi:NAD(P)-dependent dehydrogenase (short-subunit alcohol dehydrogenase family)